MSIFSTLSEEPIIKGNSVTLPIVKVGTRAHDEKGKVYILTKESLESGGHSWTDGIVTVNHMFKEQGQITKSWFEDPYVYATFEDLHQETIDAINSKAYRGVSQESTPVKVDGNKVLELKGTGSTFVFYPFKPACNMQDGCGVPLASFNLPLYTSSCETSSNTPGGVTIDDDMTKLKSTLSDLESENKDLKSTVEDLRQELKDKDVKIESTVQAAVKAALESHDKQLKEQADMNAAVAELKSCVSEDTATEFLKAEPSAAVIMSTVAAIKAESGKQVGANSGTLQSTSNDDISDLGVTSIEVE